MSVSFNQPTYIANENDGSVQAILVLSKSVANDTTVEVRTNDNTATGEHIERTNKMLVYYRRRW